MVLAGLAEPSAGKSVDCRCLFAPSIVFPENACLQVSLVVEGRKGLRLELGSLPLGNVWYW